MCVRACMRACVCVCVYRGRGMFMNVFVLSTYGLYYVLDCLVLCMCVAFVSRTTVSQR